MLTVFENTVTSAEIANMQQQFSHLHANGKFTDTYHITSREEIHELYNSNAESLIQQQRVDIREYPIADVVRNIVNKILPSPLNPSVPILFSRSVYPVGIHIDSNKKENNGHTLMIPLTFDTRIKTLVWKETAIDPIVLNEIFYRFQNDIKSFTPQPRISNRFDLRNCWLGTPSIVDFLELDGIAEWQAGSIFKFKRQQLHASNNYKASVEFKDYVLIHNDE